jgi:hypothetical protein
VPSSLAGHVSTKDHHFEYLARAMDALTPEGQKRVDELLDQLAEVAGDHEAVARFAAARKVEADSGRMEAFASVSPGRLSVEELNVLIPGFRAIRDQEPQDDVADWASAVVALLEDEAHRDPRTDTAVAASDASGDRRSPEDHRMFAWRMLANAIGWSVPSGLRTRGRRMVSHDDMIWNGSGSGESAAVLRAVENGSQADAIRYCERRA